MSVPKKVSAQRVEDERDVLNSQRGGIGTFMMWMKTLCPIADGRLDAVEVARYRQRGYNSVS
jgi:hypothetical protein